MRRAIVDGSFASLREEILTVWGNAMGSAAS